MRKFITFAALWTLVLCAAWHLAGLAAPEALRPYIPSSEQDASEATARTGLGENIPVDLDQDSGSIAAGEVVYAASNVNVRSGPGTGYGILGVLTQGQSVTRLSLGSDGWSRVSYNGGTGYIRSDLLSAEAPEVTAYGRLTIPDVGIDVALYYCTSDDGDTAQRIVDAADSAAYIDQVYVDGAIIADHNHQGFEAMKDVVPYETYAYLQLDGQDYLYQCVAVGVGKNTGSDLVDWDGVSLNYDAILGGLAMYTCNETWRSVTISYWVAI